MEVSIKNIESLEVAFLVYRGHVSGAQKIFPNIFKSIGGDLAGAPFMVYKNIDRETLIGEFELCMPTTVEPLGYGVRKKIIQPFNAISVIHKGPYESMNSTYNEIKDYIEKNNIDVKGVFWEIFIKGPTPIFKGNPKNYITEIIFPINE